jgi:hypothetical protein
MVKPLRVGLAHRGSRQRSGQRPPETEFTGQTSGPFPFRVGMSFAVKNLCGSAPVRLCVKK